MSYFYLLLNIPIGILLSGFLFMAYHAARISQSTSSFSIRLPFVLSFVAQEILLYQSSVATNLTLIGIL